MYEKKTIEKSKIGSTFQAGTWALAKVLITKLVTVKDIHVCRQNLKKIQQIQKVKDKTVQYSFLRCKVLMASVHAYISTGTQPPKHNGFKYLLKENQDSYFKSRKNKVEEPQTGSL